MRLQEARDRMTILVALRDEPHDQTQRTKAIETVYGPSKPVGMTVTRWFIECEIARIKESLRFHAVEQIDGD